MLTEKNQLLFIITLVAVVKSDKYSYMNAYLQPTYESNISVTSCFVSFLSTPLFVNVYFRLWRCLSKFNPKCQQEIFALSDQRTVDLRLINSLQQEAETALLKFIH